MYITSLIFNYFTRVRWYVGLLRVIRQHELPTFTQMKTEAFTPQNKGCFKYNSSSSSTMLCYLDVFHCELRMLDECFFHCKRCVICMFSTVNVMVLGCFHNDYPVENMQKWYDIIFIN